MKTCNVDGCDRPARSLGMCASHYAGKWNRDNREKYNENWRRYYKTNVKARREYGRSLKKRYGITDQDYGILMERQGGICAICGGTETAKSPIDDSRKRLAVDHDHETRKVRGLLCSGCNNGLGCFKDDVVLIEKALKYLERSNGEEE